VRSAHTIARRKKMNMYSQVPHTEGSTKVLADSPNAALLIDFDNVTMGMRSDLSKELKTLLQSDIIKGKVTVQRAYADWRRYPQYIVPLSEASVDLIFAPAYGSSKKNATDIRMAIDGLELVFIRPEIGTFILLTGDSDFSSLVMKLKEYGKYVIGVGIQESSSDILVQNCDEYYSYSSITGLKKTTDNVGKPKDPWELIADALNRMIERKDIMRSDRLKQVMMEIESNFNEGSYGFSKFSKFLVEASSRGIIELNRLDNGQYEVKPVHKDLKESEYKGGEVKEVSGGGSSQSMESEKSILDENITNPLRNAYDLMLMCLRELKDKGKKSVRDSNVKRKMLERDSSFHESELGFGKFSRFLVQAEEHGMISLEKTETGNYLVSLNDAVTGTGISDSSTTELIPKSSGRLGLRTGSDSKIDSEGPAFFEGQVVSQSNKGFPVSSGQEVANIDDFNMPTAGKSIVSYLTNSYKGVGRKTAEALVKAFGDDLFKIFQSAPHRISEIIPQRAERILAEWQKDYERRVENNLIEEEKTSSKKENS